MTSLEASRAHADVSLAVKEGRLIRPDICELCGRSAKIATELSSIFRVGYGGYKLNGHHYNGYDKPLDVWWICHKCNHSLCGRHDGSLTLEQARSMVRPYNLKEEFKRDCEIAMTVAKRYRGEPGLRGFEEIGDFILANISNGVTLKDVYNFAVQRRSAE